MPLVNRRIVIVLIVIIVITGLALYYYKHDNNLPPIPANISQIYNGRNSSVTEHHLKALYYDPLYREYPNDTLVAVEVTLLEGHGYDVDVFLGKNASLGQIMNMQGYDLVIIRAHGGYSNRTSGTYPRGEYIFTGLYYNESLIKYGESISSWIKKGYLALGVIPPRDNLSRKELEKLPKYLVVGPKFIEKTVHIKRGSVFIVFGCYTLQDKSLANILFEKGASAYVGWKGSVTPSYMDDVLPGVTEAYLNQGIEGLQKYVAMIKPDTYSGGYLEVATSSNT